MREILLLDEWNHPNVIENEHRPSNSKIFAQLAEVLSTGDTHIYKPNRATQYALEKLAGWRNAVVDPMAAVPSEAAQIEAAQLKRSATQQAA